MLVPQITPIPVVTPPSVPTPVPTPMPTPTLVPASTPTPTPSPTPAAVNLLQRPTPTPVIEPGYVLSINGSPVRGGQLSVPIPNGSVDLYQLARSDGKYNQNSFLT